MNHLYNKWAINSSLHCLETCFKQCLLSLSYSLFQSLLTFCQVNLYSLILYSWHILFQPNYLFYFDNLILLKYIWAQNRKLTMIMQILIYSSSNITFSSMIQQILKCLQMIKLKLTQGWTFWCLLQILFYIENESQLYTKRYVQNL